MKIQQLTRIFRYNGLDLPDPNPNFSPEEVVDFYADAYPELRNGFAEEPTFEDEKAVYNITAQVRRKGRDRQYQDTLVVSRLLPKHFSNIFQYIRPTEDEDPLYLPTWID